MWSLTSYIYTDELNNNGIPLLVLVCICLYSSKAPLDYLLSHSQNFQTHFKKRTQKTKRHNKIVKNGMDKDKILKAPKKTFIFMGHGGCHKPRPIDGSNKQSKERFTLNTYTICHYLRGSLTRMQYPPIHRWLTNSNHIDPNLGPLQ